MKKVRRDKSDKAGKNRVCHLQKMEKIVTKIVTKPLIYRHCHVTFVTPFSAGRLGNKVVKNHHFVTLPTTCEFVRIFSESLRGEFIEI